jgi:septal ring-binding cell division protein DamX
VKQNCKKAKSKPSIKTPRENQVVRESKGIAAAADELNNVQQNQLIGEEPAPTQQKKDIVSESKMQEGRANVNSTTHQGTQAVAKSVTKVHKRTANMSTAKEANVEEAEPGKMTTVSKNTGIDTGSGSRQSVAGNRRGKRIVIEWLILSGLQDQP